MYSNLYLHIEPQAANVHFIKPRYDALKFCLKAEFSATSIFYKTRCICRARERRLGGVLKALATKKKFKPSKPWWKERTDSENRCLTSNTRPKAFMCVPHIHNHKNSSRDTSMYFPIVHIAGNACFVCESLPSVSLIPC